MYTAILAGQVPQASFYTFLCSVCAPNGMPDLRVQGWVQELLLGSAYNTDKTKAAFSVDRTVLVYHTTIRQYKDGVKRIMLNTSPIGQTRPYYKVDRQDVELSVDTRSDRPKKDIQYEALTEADIACKTSSKRPRRSGRTRGWT